MKNRDLFEQLIQENVLENFQKNRYGRYALLSAHIHAMEACKIISRADVLSNMSDFTRLLTQILGEEINYKKFHHQYHNPTHHQFDMIDEYITTYDEIISND
jgi:hypothetical protein